MEGPVKLKNRRVAGLVPGMLGNLGLEILKWIKYQEVLEVFTVFYSGQIGKMANEKLHTW